MDDDKSKKKIGCNCRQARIDLTILNFDSGGTFSTNLTQTSESLLSNWDMLEILNITDIQPRATINLTD